MQKLAERNDRQKNKKRLVRMSSDPSLDDRIRIAQAMCLVLAQAFHSESLTQEAFETCTALECQALRMLLTLIDDLRQQIPKDHS